MAMIEAYKIGVALVLGGDLAPSIAALIPGFEQLDAHITHANLQAKELAAALRGVSGSAVGIGRAADNMARLAEAMDTMNRAVGRWEAGGGMPEFVPPRAPSLGARSQSTPAGRAEAGAPPPNEAIPYVPNFTMLSNGALVPYTGPARGWEPRGLVPHYQPNFTFPGEAGHDAPFFGEGEHGPPIPLNPNGRRGSGERGKGGGGGHVPGAFDGVIPALMTGELIKNIFGASFDVGAKEAELLTNGWTPEQVARARALVQAIQVSTPGATIGGGLEVVKDLGVLFRTSDGSPDVETAMKALPDYARDALVLGHSGRNAIGELFKAAQAGDLKGALSVPGSDEIDPEKFREFVHSVVVADRVTGGRVTPGMILQNVRTGGVAAAMMNDKEFFGANLAMIEGMGAQAASALSGFNRQFGAGRMGKGVAEELEGVFPGLKGHWHSVGMGQVMVDPGAMGDATQLSQHPYEFIKNTLMPGIDKLIRERTPGFDAMPADQRLVLESQEGSRIAASVSGSRAIVEVMRLWPQMVREQMAFEKAKGTDLYGIEQANNPQLKAKGLGAAYNAFEVSLGEAAQGPAIEALNNITSWLNAIAAWAKANPDGAKLALEGLAAGIMLFGVTAIAGMAMATATPALRGLAAALTLFAPGAAAGGGLAALALGATRLSAILSLLSLKGDTAGGPGPDAISREDAQKRVNEINKGTGYNGNFWHDTGHMLHLNSYHPEGGAHGPVIEHITHIHLDDREIARSVTKMQLRMMGGQVSSTLRPDPSIAPHYGAHLVET